MIERHNAKKDKKYTLAPNKFVGMDFNEFKAKYTGFINKKFRKVGVFAEDHLVPNNFPEIDPNG